MFYSLSNFSGEVCPIFSYRLGVEKHNFCIVGIVPNTMNQSPFLGGVTRQQRVTLESPLISLSLWQQRWNHQADLSQHCHLCNIPMIGILVTSQGWGFGFHYDSCFVQGPHLPPGWSCARLALESGCRLYAPVHHMILCPGALKQQALKETLSCTLFKLFGKLRVTLWDIQYKPFSLIIMQEISRVRISYVSLEKKSSLLNKTAKVVIKLKHFCRLKVILRYECSLPFRSKINLNYLWSEIFASATRIFRLFRQFFIFNTI